MTEQWISAAQALTLVGDNVTLCQRLNAGLVQARARLFVTTQGDSRAERHNASVPKEFWWATGNVALKQSWREGDFSTWVDHKIHMQAFGVTLALSGVLDMLPVERRAIAARELSVAGSKEWVSAAVLYDAVLASDVPDEQVASAIVEKASLGFLSARAVFAEGPLDSPQPQAEGQVRQEREWDVPVWLWAMLQQSGSFDSSTGHISTEVKVSGVSQKLVASDVHFLKQSVEAVFPGTLPKSPAPARRAGGRTPLAFTEDLWIAMIDELHRGKFTVESSEANVAKSMLDWAARHGHDMSSQTARLKAAKLLQALKEADKKLENVTPAKNSPRRSS